MEPIEKEFDPSEFPAEYITVGAAELMPSILDRVEDAWMRTPNAVLVIPRGAQAFHSTHDFLALGKLQDSRQVRVSIASPDPIITGLARLLGFHVVEELPDHPAFAADPSTGASSGDDIEKATAPLPLGVVPHMGLTSPGMPEWVVAPSQPVYPMASTTTSTWLGNPGEAQLYAEGARQYSTGRLPTPPQRSGVPAPRTRPRSTGQVGPALVTGGVRPSDMVTGLESTPESRPHVSPTPSGRIKALRTIPAGKAYENGRGLRYGVRLKQARWGRLLSVLAAVLVFALIGGSAYAYMYLPEATVRISPLYQNISSLPVEIPVLTGTGPTAGTGTKGSQTPAPLVGLMLRAPLTEEGTRPATGARQVPRGRAQGTMRFVNRTGSPVYVPGGTTFKGQNGAAVQTAQDVTVSPTIFGQTFGTADVPISATVDGPNGNIAAGQIAGVYDGKLDYRNLALQGGALDTIKVVTQADIDGLVAELRSRAEGKTAGGIIAAVGAGQALITPTISLANVKFEADHTSGQDGENVHVRLTAEAQAYAYNESDMQEYVAQSVVNWVQSNITTSVGFNLDLNSVKYTPQAVAATEPGKVIYKTTVREARVTFSMTPELAGQIRDLVKGKDVSQARNLIVQRYGSYVTAEGIQARLLWFTIDKLPSNPARIDVESSKQGQGQGDVPGSNPGALPPDPRSEQP